MGRAPELPLEPLRMIRLIEFAVSTSAILCARQIERAITSFISYVVRRHRNRL